MKKIIFLLALMFGLGVSAQSMYEQFNAADYAKQLTEKIVSQADITNSALQEKIQKQAYVYAQSIKKHILLAEKNGQTRGKTMAEVIQMVKPQADKASGFTRMLSQWLSAGQMKIVRELV